MKIAHITNINLNAYSAMRDESLDKAASVFTDIRENHRDCEYIVVTGGLSLYGESAGYRQLQYLLSSQPEHETAKIMLLLGIDDNRKKYSDVFQKSELDFNGFNQWIEKTSVGWFVFLDTAVVNGNPGHFCEHRLEWLAHVLDAAVGCDASVYIFMHHNPVPIRIGTAQSIGAQQIDRFHTILRKYQNTIKHIFYGQGHSAISRPVYGINLSSPRPANHPTWVEVQREPGCDVPSKNRSIYNICIIDESGVKVRDVLVRQESLELSKKRYEHDRSGSHFLASDELKRA